MNDEIHGNTLPQLHVQVIPRRVDDPFVGRPIDLSQAHYRYSEAELEQLRAALAPPGPARSGRAR